MQQKSEAESYQDTQFFLQKPLTRVLIIGFLFITAFVIRLHHISTPPLDFQPIRQYQLAHVTRSYYFEGLETLPEWRRQIASLNKERMGYELELRILDRIVVFFYRIVGGEHLWIARTLSSVFWIVGGVFLYLIAGRILTPGAALFSVFFYLFLPYGISASRSFQPDPLMVMVLLFSIFAILKYYEKPSILQWIITVTISSLAMLIKPYCIFLIFGSFLSIAFYRHGIRKSLASRDFLLFIFLSPLPGAVYYLSGVLTQGSFLEEHLQASFLPKLLLHPYFWKDWLALVARVVGLIALAVAFLGLFVVRKGLPRVFLTGLWIGYFIFGLFFNFHVHTHDYYHLQFIPVVALSIGTPGALILSRLFSSRKGITVFILLSLILLLGAGMNIKKTQRGDGYSKIFSYVAGINPQFYKFINEDFENELRISKEIGQIVNHSPSTLFLTADYGRSLTYDGELSGLPWPTKRSLSQRKFRGIKIPAKEELFNGRYFTIRTHAKYIQYTPDYFIITDFEEFEQHADLKEYLTINFPIIVKNADYLIFDTRKMKKDE